MKKIVLLTVIAFLFSLHGYSQSKNDTIAVKQVVEKESATWRSGDVRGHADCWKIQPYSKILVSTPDGKMYDIPPSTMITPSPDRFGGGGSSTNSDYNISIIGNSAWACFNEESISKEGKKTYSAEFKLLEKINGEWKIVAESVHVYNR